MHAVAHTEFSTPDRALRLVDIEIPPPGAGEVRIAVRAAAVGKGDWLVATGVPYLARPMYGIRRPKEPVAGLEFAGVVDVVGEGVHDVEPGTEVFGWGSGAFAEFVVVPADQVAPKPEGVGFDEAAAVPVSGFTALQALRDVAGLQQGQRVLVIGASGGVGSFAIQIANGLGAEVTGVASTPNVGFVRSLGADHVVDYTVEEVTEGDRRFDVIVDIAGNRSIRSLRRILEPGGTLVIVGGSGGRWTMGYGRTIRAVVTSPFVRQRLRTLISKPNAEDLGVLAGLMSSGSVAAAVGQRFALVDAPAAVDLVGTGRSRGKTVVTV
ncbi:MAG: NAD(P)-dependent alcohol dehydrogenase [Acidimicrobiia bacterium]|nr:NAD(P)-dependent alcohol dehydrogenase [Acidimicrobiia bacterium]